MPRGYEGIAKPWKHLLSKRCIAGINGCLLYPRERDEIFKSFFLCLCGFLQCLAHVRILVCYVKYCKNDYLYGNEKSTHVLREFGRLVDTLWTRDDSVDSLDPWHLLERLRSENELFDGFAQQVNGWMDGCRGEGGKKTSNTDVTLRIFMKLCWRLWIWPSLIQCLLCVVYLLGLWK